MFAFTPVPLKHSDICLVLPDISQAESLYNCIEDVRTNLAKWLPWANKMTSVADERKFIEYARVQTAKYEMLALTILADREPIGTLDFHNIDFTNSSAEIGYWLSGDFQGGGIMTFAVSILVEYALTDFGLDKVTIHADAENKKSIALAERLDFSFEKKYQKTVENHDKPRTFLVYSKHRE